MWNIFRRGGRAGREKQPGGPPIELWANSIGQPIRIRSKDIPWNTDHEWFQRKINRILTKHDGEGTLCGKKWEYWVTTEEHRGMSPVYGTEITIYRMRRR